MQQRLLLTHRKKSIVFALGPDHLSHLHLQKTPTAVCYDDSFFNSVLIEPGLGSTSPRDIDTVLVGSLKALDPERPIRETEHYPERTRVAQDFVALSFSATIRARNRIYALLIKGVWVLAQSAQ